MGYTIFQHDQIAPRTVQRGDDVRENPAMPQLPDGAFVCYRPADYDRFSDDPAKRKLLLNDPDGIATPSAVFVAFPTLKTSRIDKGKSRVSAELAKTDYKVIKQAEGVYTLTDQEKADRQSLRDKFTAFETSILNATDIATVLQAVFTI